MATVAALAVVVMLITTALAISAVVARHAAERRQKQAENLVNFMLGDLNDKLSQVSRLDIMEVVDNQAMSYFESLPTSDVTDEALVQRAKALEKIGTVRMNQGHLPAAMESFQSGFPTVGFARRQKAPDARYCTTRLFASIGLHRHGGLVSGKTRYRATEASSLHKKSLQGAEQTFDG